LAKQFGFSTFFVVKILRLGRRGKQLATQRRGGDRKPRLTAEMRWLVRPELAAQNDLTLREMCRLAADNFDVSVSSSTIY